MQSNGLQTKSPAARRGFRSSCCSASAVLLALLTALTGTILLLLLSGLLTRLTTLLLLARLLAGLIALLLLTRVLIGVLILIHRVSFQRWSLALPARTT
jgi:hypothetical protein